MEAQDKILEDINEYVDRQPWEKGTKRTAAYKLRKIFSISNDPEKVSQYFELNGYSKYTIKQYLILAGGYNAKFKSYFSSRKNLFKNAYKTKTRMASEAEVQDLLIGSNEFYNAIYLMGFCGLRISEALEVTYSDQTEEGVLTVVGKGDKQRQVPCDFSKLKVSPSLSPEAKIAGDVSVVALRKYLAISGLTPHDLRAFFITRTVRSRQLDLDEIAVVVGHSSLNTTQRYLRHNIQDIKRKLLG